MDYNEFDTDLVRTLKPVKVKKKSSVGKTLGLLLACGVVSGSCGVGGAYLYHNYSNTGSTPQIIYANPTVEAQKVVTYSNSDVSLPDLYTMNVGATVGITVSMTTVNYFGQPTSSAASGSGFVITENGYVVTNHHVIEDAIGATDSPIEVKFHNGDSYTATIVGYEADSDLAVLKIEATGLQTVVFGDSDSLVVGETLVAIGNPLGELDFTFTNGIVSAKDRVISIGDGYTMNMLQTNTAINPGNSGGPLFDGSGYLVGINTAKYAESSSGISVEGLGFAIPINDVKDKIADIIENGYVTGKPYLGVTVSDVSAEAQQYGVRAGASILSVAPDSAASKAGIQINDIIVAIGDVAVDSSGALTAALNDYRAGDTTTFTVVRENQEVKLTLTFDEKNAVTESNNQYAQDSSTQEEGNNSPNGNNWDSWGDSWSGNFPFGGRP